MGSAETPAQVQPLVYNFADGQVMNRRIFRSCGSHIVLVKSVVHALVVVAGKSFLVGVDRQILLAVQVRRGGSIADLFEFDCASLKDNACLALGRGQSVVDDEGPAGVLP